MSRYWEDVVSESLEIAGIIATKEQIFSIAESVRISHENYGMDHGHDAIPNPIAEELKKTKEALKKEQRMVFCIECNGKGSIWTQGPVHGSVTQCYKCAGNGKHLP